MTAASALAHPYLEDGRLRYHTCMCRCCRTPEGLRYTDDAEPICRTPFHFNFEDDLASISKVRGVFAFKVPFDIMPLFYFPSLIR